MLSRTADNLFWLARYVERAEYLARIIEASTRLANLPSAYAGTSNEWESAVATAGCAHLFFQAHEKATRETVIDFLAFSPDNPSSIRSCFEVARTNARSVRTALTVEMWEAINSAWLELSKYRASGLNQDEHLANFLSFVKETGLRFDGSAYRTMLRSDGYWFSRLGVMIERADNTARILDVKYYVLLPSLAQIGSSLDNMQWETVLRSVAGQRAYRWLTGGEIAPMGIAEFVILDRRMPRSLAFSVGKLAENLGFLEKDYGIRHASHDLADALLGQLNGRTIDAIFEGGLHEFLTAFLVDIAALGGQIERDYRFYG